VNRADGISEVEGKGRRGDRASMVGSEFSKSVSEKISVPMSTLIALSRLWQWKAKYETKKTTHKIKK
jgi:hypothetical protein